MTQPLQIIDKIGFEDGTFIELNQLPDSLRLEVEQYNDWTEQLASVNRQIEALTKQQRQLSYARSASYTIVNQAALQLQQDLAKANETPSQSFDETPDPVDSQDPQ